MNKEQIEERLKAKVEYHKNCIKTEQGRAKLLTSFWSEIGRLQQEYDVSFRYILGSVIATIPGDDYDRAWDLASAIDDALTSFNIEHKVKKIFATWSKDPYWYWQIKSSNLLLNFEVNYAEPDPDCIPVKETRSEQSWVCYKK